MRASRKLIIYQLSTPYNYKWVRTYYTTSSATKIFTVPSDGWYFFHVIGKGGKGGDSGRAYVVASTTNPKSTGGSGGAGGTGGYSLHRLYLTKDEQVTINLLANGTSEIVYNGDSVRALAGTDGTDGTNGSATSGGQKGIGGIGGGAVGGNYLNLKGEDGLDGLDGVRNTMTPSLNGVDGGSTPNPPYPQKSRYMNGIRAMGGKGGIYPNNINVDGDSATSITSGSDTILGNAGAGGASYATYISSSNGGTYDPPTPFTPIDVNIKYISDINETETISIPSQIVDGEINSGRILLSNIATIGFTPPTNKYFVGWKSVETNKHYDENDYYSLKDENDIPTMMAVWGSKVYLSGDGHDDNDGLTYDTRVRTLGRAYEVLARIESGNPNANINKISVTGDSTNGFTAVDDVENYVTDYNGKIILCGDINYCDTHEGRYKGVTFNDVRSLGTGTVIFNDGVGNETIQNVNDSYSYDNNELIRVTRIGTRNYYLQPSPKASSGQSGYFYHLLKKELNQYTYQYNSQTYYTYGRLIQYSYALRTHTSLAVSTPKNSGLVHITSKDDLVNYKEQTYFNFSEFTRYCLGSDLIICNIRMRFDNNKSVESTGYIGGIAAYGNYFALGENLTIPIESTETSTYFRPNMYGGGASYRYNSNNFIGTNGSNLGDAGIDPIPNTRISIRSGEYQDVYGGSYGGGVTIGGAIQTYGTSEDNASTITIHGGNVANIAGGGHEGGSCYNAYTYIYDFTSNPIVAGGCYGSGGSTIGNGNLVVLLNKKTPGSTSNRVRTMYGGSSRNANITSNTFLHIKSGRVDEIYGGSNEQDVTGNSNIFVYDGVIGKIIGAGKTASLTGKATITILGGEINNTIYSSSAGSTSVVTTSMYRGTDTDTDLNNQILDPSDSRLSMLLPVGDEATHADAIKDISTIGSRFNQRNNGFIGDYKSAQIYKDDLNNDQYRYNIYNSDYSKVVTGYAHSTYTNHGPTQYLILRYVAELKLASVGEAECNILGGVVNGDVYGGGEVALVNGNATVRILGGTINGSVYSGGNGSVKPAVAVYNDMKPYDGSSWGTIYQNYTWVGEDVFDISSGQYSPDGNTPIDYTNRLIYSPNYKYMGSVYGDSLLVIGNDVVVNGEAHPGGNQSNVFGEVTIVIDGAVIGGFGQGGQGSVGGVVIEQEI